jgi:hypothetical protein
MKVIGIQKYTFYVFHNILIELNDSEKVANMLW